MNDFIVRTRSSRFDAAPTADSAVQTWRVLYILWRQANRHDISAERDSSSLQHHQRDVVVHSLTLSEILVDVVVLDIGLHFGAFVDLLSNHRLLFNYRAHLVTINSLISYFFHLCVVIPGSNEVYPFVVSFQTMSCRQYVSRRDYHRATPMTRPAMTSNSETCLPRKSTLYVKVLNKNSITEFRNSTCHGYAPFGATEP